MAFLRSLAFPWLDSAKSPSGPSFCISSLETLLLGLGLSSSNGCSGVGVVEAAAILAVLELRRLSGAHADTAGVRAARGRAVGVTDASARDELRAVTLADFARTGVVRLDLRKGRHGDCIGLAVVS